MIDYYTFSKLFYDGTIGVEQTYSPRDIVSIRFFVDKDGNIRNLYYNKNQDKYIYLGDVVDVSIKVLYNALKITPDRFKVIMKQMCYSKRCV